MTILANRKHILVILCLMGALLLAGCSEEAKKAETPSAAAVPGGGPQRQSLNSNGPVGGTGTAKLRSFRSK